MHLAHRLILIHQHDEIVCSRSFQNQSGSSSADSDGMMNILRSSVFTPPKPAQQDSAINVQESLGMGGFALGLAKRPRSSSLSGVL